MNYYNEIDPYCGQWLRNLIQGKYIPDGKVDERSIADVMPGDLDGFAQCHFFAGLAGWPRALELAGWPADRQVWTGSCPCQPFSVAGKGQGVADERHLWPEFYRLIRAVMPDVVMGEQVSGAAGMAWLDGVVADLEGEGYACRAADIPACAVNAPHRRNRLYWVASYFDSTRLQTRNEYAKLTTETAEFFSWREFERIHAKGFWSSWETQSGIRVFVDGVPARVARLRALGNAIVPQCAAEFVAAFLDTEEMRRGRDDLS